VQGAVAIILAPGPKFSVDNLSGLIFYPRMLNLRLFKNGAAASRIVLPAFALFLGLSGITGCSLAPLAKQSGAFSAATTSVVTSSKDAYRKANSLYFEEESSSAIFKYDKSMNWDPYSVKPLLNDKQLQARYTLLDGLKAYAKDVDAVENEPKNLKGLDTAAESVGNGLLSVSTNLNADLTSANSGATTHTLTQEQANIVSTATYALGEFLAARKVKSNLPRLIEKMDPTITAICQVLEADITVIQTFTDNAYSEMVIQQDHFIRSSPTMDAVDRRSEIAKLPKLVQRQRASHDLLDDLKSAIHKMAMAHHALAYAANGDNSISLASRIADLEAAAQNLASFYATLPTS
jgi:hypothetical protein